MKFYSSNSIKYLMFILCLFLYGCMRPDEMSHIMTTVKVDFTKYTAKGFLFTPESYNDQYESIGILKVTIEPEILKLKNKKEREYNQVTHEGSEWLIESIKFNEAIDSIFTLASSMGANAITRFQLERVLRNDYGLLYNSYEVSGFAIKRINK
jgi:hypothetical protein